MSRIQQILSRADRDRTTAGLTWPGSAAQARSSPNRTDDPDADAEYVAVNGASSVHHAPSALLDIESPPIAERPPSDAPLHKHLVAALQPGSPAAQRYRMLAERIAALEGGVPRHIIAVTSPVRGDGKTLTGCNLALTMAQDSECRTLLIDAHLRRPRIHALLGLTREPGLIDVLGGAAPLERAVVTLAGHRLQVLTAGSSSGQRSQLLGSPAMQRLVQGLRHRFDRIVIDTGSTEGAETRALEPWIDGVLLVVRAGRTTGPDIDRALSRVPAAKLMGMVLNDSHSTNEATTIEDADAPA